MTMRIAGQPPRRGRMARRRTLVLLSVAAVSLLPLAALAQAGPEPDDVDRALRDLRAPEATASWNDDAHHRDRVDAVPGYPEFAEEEAAIRSALDAGLAQGWLDRDDFLIFGRQLHQTELREARTRRLYGPNPSDHERREIRAALSEMRVQLDDTRGRRDEAGGQMADNRDQR